MKLKLSISIILLCVCLHASALFHPFVYEGIRYNADEETRECEVLYRTDYNMHTISIPNIVYDTIWKYILPPGETESVKVVDKLEAYIPSVIVGGAFQQSPDITSVNLGPITKIGNSAFSNTSISSINSELVISIETRAFEHCSLLESVDFPAVKSIGSYAFSTCSRLNEVNFPEDTIIGSNAFNKCSKLVSAVFPKVAEIGYNAFVDCDSLQTFVLPPTLTELGESAFQGCIGLKSVMCTCPLLKEIPSSCFRFCESLKDFDFYSMKLEKIGAYAFDGCSSLTEIHFSEDLTAIEGSAFHGCSSLKKIYINSTPTLGGYAFDDCTTLHTFHLTVNELTPSMSVVMPNTTKVLQVLELASNSTEVPNDCFSGCSALHTIEMPEGIKFIGDRAFMDNKNLKTVTLPDSLLRIGNAAFYHSGIEEITFPNKVSYIGNEAFRYCNLKEVQIPAAIDTVGYRCFQANEHLQQVSIKGTPTWLNNGGGNDAFNACPEIMYIEMMCHRDTYNPYFLFNGSQESVEEFRLLEGSTAIGYNRQYYTGWESGALNNFVNLKKVTIPEGVELIGMAAFENCTSLKDITLPASLDSIGYKAFAGSGLEEISLPADIDWVEEQAFQQCRQLQKADMGGLEILPVFVLRGCESLTCLIADSAHVIQRQACDNTSLSSVYLPETCDSLLLDAIPFNSTVKKVICKAETPPFVSSMYTTFSVNTDIHLYVPSQSIAAYSTAPLWQQFAFIEPLENNPLDPEDCHEQENTPPTALEENKTPNTLLPYKIIDNGSMVIVIPNGGKYNVMGQKE